MSKGRGFLSLTGETPLSHEEFARLPVISLVKTGRELISWTYAFHKT